MAKKLFIADERMLMLMEWAIQKGIVDNETEYWERIGFARTSISNVRAGTQGFRTYHILNACRLTGASADYIFGLTNVIERKTAAQPIHLLEQAVAAIKLDMRGK